MPEPKTTLYLQYPDFRVLVFNVITAATPDGEMMRAAVNTGKPHKVRDFGNENIGLYLVLPKDLAPGPIPEDEDGPFAMFVIRNMQAERPKRLDLTISRSANAHSIRAILLADKKDIRFDGDIPVHADDSTAEDPFYI